jgi:hypothetical protein
MDKLAHQDWMDRLPPTLMLSINVEVCWRCTIFCLRRRRRRHVSMSKTK